MTLYIIGLGLGTEKDITVRGKEIIEKCSIVYIENYTSLLQCSLHDLAKYYNKELIIADRKTTEQGDEKIVEEARENDVAFLVIGDPFSATTHMQLFKLAKESGVKVEVVHNASILTAVGIVGLELYKYGKVTSIPFLNDFPQLETPYNVIKENLSFGMHTLCLLDIKVPENRFMSVNQAIDVLLDIESRKKQGLITDDLIVVGCARLGRGDFVIKSGKLSEIRKFDFGDSPHSLIIPGKMHFVEEEMVELWDLVCD
jgi:diphthine methyl ester synthase